MKSVIEVLKNIYEINVNPKAKAIDPRMSKIFSDRVENFLYFLKEINIKLFAFIKAFRLSINLTTPLQ